MKICDPTSDLRTRGDILFEMLNLNLIPGCRDFRYLRYIDSKVEKTVDEIFVVSITSLTCRSRYIYLDMRKFT